MKINKNKFADVVLLKLHPIRSVFLVCFRTVTLQRQGIKIILVQRYFNVVTLKQHWITVLTPSVCRVFVWTPIPACSWTTGTLCKRDSLAIYLKIREQELKVAPWENQFLALLIVNINNFSRFIPPENMRNPKSFW